MDITVKDIYAEIDHIAPFIYQESWDNSGLQIGSLDNKVKKVLLALDITKEAVNIAKKYKCELVISHHPLFFKPLKTIDTRNVLLKEILNSNLTILSAHTNLDVVPDGVSFALAKKIGILNNLKILAPLEETKYYKVAFFITKEAEADVLSQIFNKGIGEFHNYEKCYFTTSGLGHFKAKENAKPYVKIENFKENKVEFIVRKDKLFDCINNLKQIHPYDEIAFDVFEEKINPLDIGYGVIGELSTPKKLHQVLFLVKEALGIEKLRFKGDLNKKIKKIALCGGSGSSFIKHAIQSKADLYITGDIKYHEMLENCDKITITDVGHRASEQPVLFTLKEKLEKTFKNLELQIFIEHNDFYQYI